MSETVFFYSPMKSPDAGASSGVRRIGGLFVEALRLAGFHVEVPDLPSTFEGNGDANRQSQLRNSATNAAAELIDKLRTAGVRPTAWLTYHCYYKSPDVIGPAASAALNCPYLIAEPSFARKRAVGAWAGHHAAAVEALLAADVLLAATTRDRTGLLDLAGRKGRITSFPPFVDCEPFAEIRRTPSKAAVRILSAGSMNDARKGESYTRLFSAMETLQFGAASLEIAGDGALRSALEKAAEPLRQRGTPVRFLGQLPHHTMPAFFASGDVFAWPGVGEAYGLTYLEAQASGLPVVAQDSGGVSECVCDGVSGFLTAPGDQRAYADALNQLVDDELLRRQLGLTARDWVRSNRSIPIAAQRIRTILAELRT